MQHSLLVQIMVCMAQISLFSAEPCSKSAGKSTIVLRIIMARELNIWRITTSHNPNQNRAAFWRIFLTNKNAPANRKKDSIQTMIRTSRRLDSFFVWSGSELWSLFKYSKLTLKNQKPLALDVFFKAYPISCRSNLTSRHL